jgi:hypothetical protein
METTGGPEHEKNSNAYIEFIIEYISLCLYNRDAGRGNRIIPNG